MINLTECFGEEAGKFTHASAAFEQSVEYMKRKKRGEILEFATRWSHVNAQLGGGIPTDVTMVIGARPGKGKSLIANNIAYDIFRLNPNLKTVLIYWNWEMPAYQQGIRLLSEQSKTTYTDLVSQKAFNLEIKTYIEKLRNDLSVYDFYYMDISCAAEFVYNANYSLRVSYPEYKIVNIFDHTRLVRKGNERSEEEKLTHLLEIGNLINKELSGLCIFLSQLNRSYETRNLGKSEIIQYTPPVQSDLFGSDAIGQFGHIILMPHNPGDFGHAYFPLRTSDINVQNISTDNLMIWEIVKNRNGPMGFLLFDYKPEFFSLDRHPIYNTINKPS